MTEIWNLDHISAILAITYRPLAAASWRVASFGVARSYILPSHGNDNSAPGAYTLTTAVSKGNCAWETALSSSLGLQIAREARDFRAEWPLPPSLT